MRYHTLLLALCASVLSVSASSPPSFCKCTCFTNSTIIPLTPIPPPSLEIRSNPPPSPPIIQKHLNHLVPPPLQPFHSNPSANPPSDNINTSPNPATLSSLHKRAPPASCTRCNRAYCLSLNLPICKGAEEKDVSTMCFQRDSRKDQIVVLGFVAVTLGLLGWAGGRDVLARRQMRGAVEGNYVPVSAR